MEEKSHDILYHYCSVDTFLKIVQNKTLRLSEISKSNDSMECQWLEKKVIPEIITRMFNLSPFATGIENRKKTMTEAEKVLELFNRFYAQEDNIYSSRIVLASCFSEVGDQLSQWRAYSNNGYGVTIGFDSEMFKMFENKGYSGFDFKKIIYKFENYEPLIITEIGGFFKALRDKLSIQEIYEALRPVVVKAALMSPHVKNPAFIEEQEWRLFLQFINIFEYQDLISIMKANKLEEKFSDLGAISKNDDVVLYYDLRLNEIAREIPLLTWIREIIIGPKCRLKDRDIRLLLEKFGWDTSQLEITKSSATYV